MTAEGFDELYAAAEQRCLAIRRGGFGPYGALIRATMRETLASMFPRFAAQRGVDELNADIEAFCIIHGASRAPFIQLGTEFLEFMQGRLGNRIDRIVLEYEWLLFEAEVHPATVHAWSVVDGQEGGRLELNPTLRWIASPIDLLHAVGPIDTAPKKEAPLVYAVYRRADHRVVTKPLNAVDIARLQAFEAGPVVTPFPLDSWLSDALREDLLSYSPIFEALHDQSA